MQLMSGSPRQEVGPETFDAQGPNKPILAPIAVTDRNESILSSDLSTSVRGGVKRKKKRKKRQATVSPDPIKDPGTPQEDPPVRLPPRPPTAVKIPCASHPNEYIKYFCRDDMCKKGICPSCIFDHAKHDFIVANDVAVFEIKQALRAAALACSNKLKSNQMLVDET
jgi:hypothetical protein